MTSERPDPDLLLKTLDQAEAHARRGRLRIYFGASAGVGKTYAMLAHARAQHAEGLDVLAGIVETHGRPETAALLEGLPRLPPARLAFQGRMLEEFDLPEALRRRPRLLLLDELAHSNAPGARHAKRWQDADELLEAGIDVWTTLNVQHLDSLNEAVGGITGIRVAETVPDTVFDGADEIILVDLSADALLQRLRAGQVYLPEQARHAAHNFFRKGNLIALRELALHRTADHVNHAVHAYRQEQVIAPVWRTREAVAACIAADAQAVHVVRSAHRLARQLDAELHVITVTQPGSATPARGQHQLEQALAQAEAMGARIETLAGPQAAATAAAYLRRHNLTKAVVGQPRAGWRRRWALAGPGFAEALGAACPDIDLLRVARPPVRPPADAAPPPAASPPRLHAGYAWSLLYCALAALASHAVFPLLDQTNIAMVFLLAVVAAALRHGRGPSALAAVVSVALFDLLFVQPLGSFAVSDVQYLLTFAVLLGVGLLVGQLTAGLRVQAQAAASREADVRGLYELARELSSALQPVQIAAAAEAFLDAAFDAHAALHVLELDEQLRPAAPAPAGMAAPDPAILQWVHDHGQPAGAGTGTLAHAALLYLPLKAPMRVRGVLALQLSDPRAYALPQVRRKLEAYATLIAIALERLHYVEVAQHALVGMESERLRNSVLAAVSHDLRTPLTSLVGMSETLLRSPAGLSDATREVLSAMRAQTLRLHAQVVNLLDMARLQSAEAPLRRGWQSIEELVGAALAELHEPLATHHVEVAPLSRLPLVECDGVLIQRVLVNLLENAAKHTPRDSRIRIGASASDATLAISVEDDGPGIPPGMEQRIFEKFTRADRESATPGVGLGLAVCRAIVDAHGGAIHAESRPAGRGARFVFTLPLGQPPGAPPDAS